MRRWLASLALLAIFLPALAGDLPSSIQKSLNASSNKNAITQLQNALQGELVKGEEAWIRLYIAEYTRLSGDLSTARSMYEAVAVDFPGHRARSAAAVGMALIDAKGSPGGNTRATLELMPEEGVPDTLNADRYLLLAQTVSKEGGDGAVINNYAAKARRYAAVNKETSKRIEAGLSNLSSPATTAPAAPEIPTGTPEEQAIARVRSAIQKGDLTTARSEAEQFLSTYPSSPFSKEANYAKQRAINGTVVVRNRIGVLLPASGTWAPAARNVRIALELAASRSDSGIELRFFDSAGTGDACVKQLEEAVLKQGVSMVVGPLIKDEALLCGPAAQALHTPMLALTSWEDVAAAGDQVFRAYPSTAQLVNALLDETVTVRGLKRYAIVYPQTPYGENAVHAMETSLKAHGAVLVTKVSYAANANDFRKVATTLKQQDPALSYDAIFVPDAYQRVPLLASALAYEEIPVGRFKPHSSMHPITLVGLNGWNNDELPRRGGTYVLDAIFVDAFDTHSESTALSDFITTYKDKSGGSAPTLIEAVGYDTLRLAAAAVKTTEPDLAIALKAAQLIEPIAGTRGINEAREVTRSWRLMTIGNQGIEPLPAWAPPPPEP